MSPRRQFQLPTSPQRPLASRRPSRCMGELFGQVREVLIHARQHAHRSVNQAMVQAYWQVGRLIVEHEQAGQARAAYGAQVLAQLAERLTAELGRLLAGQPAQLQAVPPHLHLTTFATRQVAN
jgi:hypothetical protein